MPGLRLGECMLALVAQEDARGHHDSRSPPCYNLPFMYCKSNTECVHGPHAHVHDHLEWASTYRIIWIARASLQVCACRTRRHMRMM
jgi:hypothetical protein